MTPLGLKGEVGWLPVHRGMEVILLWGGCDSNSCRAFCTFVIGPSTPSLISWYWHQTGQCLLGGPLPVPSAGVSGEGRNQVRPHVRHLLLTMPLRYL